jgi:uncharacterized linocin/CFP29 family protein
MPKSAAATQDLLIVGNDGSVPQAYGTVAQRLLASNFDINGLRTLDVLRKDEWIQFDQVVVEVARERLRGVADLLSAGLRFNILNGLGTTQVQWETVSDMTEADVSMSGVTEGEEDRVVYSLKTLPLPIVHKDFHINIRALEASRRLGESLDTTMAALASRLVAEKIEEILFDGHAITVSGQNIEGYTNATNRNTGSLTRDWATSTEANRNDIVSNVITMIGAAAADNMFGPYVLYVPLDYWNELQEDYKEESDRTTLERLLAIDGLSGINVSQRLDGAGSGEVVLVQMTRDVVDMVVGLLPTTVQWEVQGGMRVNFKVMAIMVPRMKSDAASQSGIVHYSV